MPAFSQPVIPIPIASGLSQPLAIEHAGDGTGDLYIVEQAGRILMVSNGVVQLQAFLDIRDRVGCCMERGLLGLAFHPDYVNNGEYFVNYTNNAFDTVIARYTADGNVTTDAATEEILLTINQPFANHNGGQLAFGPDGYLYIGTGDGGSGGDPQNNAQNPQSLLGKMLRIDVDSGNPYGIPADNPFINNSGTLDEIWATGLRNPFRFSFDVITGDLYIADVGQNLVEEVILVPGFSLSSFGQDEDGELYVADLGGSVYKLVQPIIISPGSGSYLTTQVIDLSFILRKPGVTITGLEVRLNGLNISTPVGNCLREGQLADGGLSFRCPGIPLRLLPEGVHTLAVSADLSDGSSVTDSVIWEILENSEP